MWNDVESLAFFRREVRPDKSFCGATITKDTGHPQFYSNEQLELMQFTGKLDKNGKEIWEGDIVQNADRKFLLVYFDSTEGAFRQTTDFKNPGRRPLELERYQFTDLPMNYNEKEVIGNIYENPELVN